MKNNYAYMIPENQNYYTSSHLWRLFVLGLFCFLLSLALILHAHAQTGTSNELADDEAIIWLTTPGSGSILDCYTKEITIKSDVHRGGVNLNEGATFQWTGPDGFSSDTKDIIVTKPGIYKLVAKTANGLTGENSIEILGYNYPKKFAGPDLNIHPSTKTVKLQGYSHGFYDISWEASNGGNIVSGENTLNPIVDAPGTYTITLTGRRDGCTMQDSMVVTEAEDVFIARITLTESSTLECNDPGASLIGRATLNGETKHKGITYSWTGPDNFSAETQDITAPAPGEYVLTVTDTSTGYTASASQTIYPPIYPIGSAGPDKQLTCTSPSVQLEGNMERGVHLIWLASDGGHIVSGARTPTPVVDAPGTYILIMDMSINGCKLQDTVVVTRAEAPALTATGGSLDCATGSVQLQASSTTEGVTYMWTGPSGYTSSEQNPTVTVAGDYTLTVTDPETGCTASTMVAVTPSSSELTAQDYLIDFNSEKNGLISSIETDAGPVSITGRKRNPGSTETFAPENHAAIFNTQAPTGDDADLYTTDWGRVLIINENLEDVPDKNRWGGELILDFSAIGPVTLESMGLLDLDYYEDMSWVYMYDEAGNELNKIYLKTMGNNSKQTVDLGNTRGVTKLKVVLDGRDGSGYFAGSGAIDDIKFRVEKEVASPCENAQQPEALQALAYPTTFSDRATVQFTLQDAGDYSVNLYDTQGNLVKELKTGTAMANEQVTIEVTAGSMKEGMYLARIISPVGNKTLKLILKR